jgi:hypothetical protein
MTSRAPQLPRTRSYSKLTSSRTSHVLYITVIFLFIARPCEAACIPKNSSAQPSEDAFSLLLYVQNQCPGTALDFGKFVERSGAKLETTMVSFVSFSVPKDRAVDMEEYRVMQQGNAWQLSAGSNSENSPQGDDHAWERREEFLRRRLPQTEKPDKSDPEKETGQSPGGRQPEQEQRDNPSHKGGK